jgi:hypothetical protein
MSSIFFIFFKNPDLAMLGGFDMMRSMQNGLPNNYPDIQLIHFFWRILRQTVANE